MVITQQNTTMKLNEKGEKLSSEDEGSEKNQIDTSYEVQQKNFTSKAQLRSSHDPDNPFYDKDLEQVLKELSELRFSSSSAECDTESRSSKIIEKQHIQLNGIQLIYQFLVWLMSITTTFVSPAQTDVADYSGEAKIRKAQTAASIFFLNAISILNSIKSIFSGFSNIHKNDPSILSIYFSFVGISTDIQFVFLFLMASITSNFASFATGLLFLGLSSIAVILCIPLILVLISTMLATSLSISVTTLVVNRAYATVNNYIPLRSILTYFADQIPPSVGRVEVTHQKQRKDFEEKTKTQKSIPNGN